MKSSAFTLALVFSTAPLWGGAVTGKFSYGPEHTAAIHHVGRAEISGAKVPQITVTGPLKARQVEIEYVSVTGPVKLQDSTVHTAKITGPLKMHRCNVQQLKVVGPLACEDSTIHTFRVTGPSTLKNVQITTAVLTGPLNLDKSRVGTLSLNGKAALNDATIHTLTVRRQKSSLWAFFSPCTPQTVFLSGTTRVDHIIFETEGGEVILAEGTAPPRQIDGGARVTQKDAA